MPKAGNIVRVVSDSNKINLYLVCKPSPIPKVLGYIQELEGFKFATDLNHYSHMGQFKY